MEAIYQNVAEVLNTLIPVPWREIHLNNSGEFNIDYGYEDLSQVDSYEQQIIWKYNHLGIIPASRRAKDFIDRYLTKKEN